MYVTPTHFVAATPGSNSSETRAEQLGARFDSVLSELMQNGAGNDFVQQLRGNKEQYIELITRAEQAGGDAKTFIRGLSPEERAVLQQVHSLGDPITEANIDQMSDEGAANLLRMRGDGLDSNRDGLTDNGIAHTFKFPNSNTPADVAAAWEKTMEGKSFEERLLAEGSMMIELMTANMRIDENGRVIAAEPGDMDWVNPFNSEFSYQDWAEGRLAYLEGFKSSMSPEQYSRDKLFASTFLANLKAAGAA